ncbi:MAG TPA: squalene synthase HpnC [Acetobacteraceae bacterium]|nr:squalene synthase HpnC [Acetobacteraceae bacterium]
MNDIANVETWSGKDRKDENFPVGSRLIRPKLRVHVHAFYNFARNADDIADSPTLTPEDKLARLDVMEAVLLGRSDDGSPSALALRDSLAKTRVTPVHATELLIAFRLDATKQRYTTLTELYEYCRYSAAPVGRYVLDLHRESHKTHAPSDALCSALQILNHLQDCAVDLKTLDRCYLPEDLLAEFGSGTGDLRKRAMTPGLRKVFDSLLHRVERMTRFASELPPRTRDRRLRLETAVIVGLAKRLANRLARQDPLAAPVKLTKRDFVTSTLVALRHL